MKIKAVIHNAEEGGYWAEVPSVPGCVTQGDSFEELLTSLNDAVEGCLSVEMDPSSIEPGARALEIGVQDSLTNRWRDICSEGLACAANATHSDVKIEEKRTLICRK